MWLSTQNVFVHIIPHCDFNINNIYIIDKFICVKMDNLYFPQKKIMAETSFFGYFHLFESIINDFSILN